MAEPIKMKVEVELPSSPELCARMFVEMDSEQQAKVLSMIWDGMRASYGSAYKAAMQCAYIRDEQGFDTQAMELIEHLVAEETPAGFVFEVNREPTLPELLQAKKYIDQRLADHGADRPKTYTVEKRHDDGSTSTVSGLTGDEVLDLYLNDDALVQDDRDQFVQPDVSYASCIMRMAAGEVTIGDDGRHAYKGGTYIGKVVAINPDGTVDVAMEPSRLYDKARRFAEAYGMGPEKFMKAMGGPKTTCPDCKGSGEYRGFTNVEPCTRCGGNGTLNEATT